MKKQHSLITYFSVFCLSILFLCSPLQAQIEPVDKKVKRKTNRRIDQKVDKGVDDALNALEGIFKKKNKKKKRPSDSEPEVETEDSRVRVEGEEVIVEDDEGNEEVTISYSDEEEVDEGPVEPSSFIGSFKMEIHTFKKGKEEKDSPAIIGYHIDKYKFALQPKTDEGDITMVYDRQNKTVTNIMRDQNQAMIMKQPRVKVKMKSKADGENDYKVTKTGRTKTIEGYLCYEYTVESPEETGTFWLTEDLGVDFTQFTDMAGVKTEKKNKAKMGYFNTNVYGVKGIVIEAHSQSLKKDESYDMYLKDWKVGSVDEEVFSTKGLKVTDMTSFSFPGR